MNEGHGRRAFRFCVCVWSSNDAVDGRGADSRLAPRLNDRTPRSVLGGEASGEFTCKSSPSELNPEPEPPLYISWSLPLLPPDPPQTRSTLCRLFALSVVASEAMSSPSRADLPSGESGASDDFWRVVGDLLLAVETGVLSPLDDFPSHPDPKHPPPCCALRRCLILS